MESSTSLRCGADDIDVHQHLWPPELVDRLRARSSVPYLRGWQLFTCGEPPFPVNPADHDAGERSRLDREDRVGLSCVSLSAPLGMESLPRPEAATLLGAWHAGAARLPEGFAAWASAPSVDPDLDEVQDLLGSGFVGLQVPATELLSPAAWNRSIPLLCVAEETDKPVLVHPGPVERHALAGDPPAWWPAVVGYVQQMHAAWWGWHAASVRASLPRLRVIFAAGAGLAPIHRERHAARGGEERPLDDKVFVDTSSYGPQAVDALTRVLGIDAVLLGSDRPYARAADVTAGDAARHALRNVNPRRALGLEETTTKEARPWPRAS